MSKMMHCLSSNDIPEPSVSNITFYLFTQRNPSVGEVISLDNSCIEDLDNDLSANNDNSNNDDYYYNYIDTDSMLCRSKKNIQEQSQWRSRHSRHPKSKDSVAVIPTKNGTFNKIKHLKYGKSVISSKYFDLNDNTKIIIHGYTQSYVTEAIVKLKNAYLSKGSFNVILVDWSVLAAGPCYNIATKYARFVGFIVSKLISQLTLGGINTKSIHIIGFSLGAQVAGFAGSNYNTGRVQRITGLDPALPLFPTKKESDGILDADDAYFVDIIHTSHILGQVRPLGHADFYPNGGFRQPGCDVSVLKIYIVLISTNALLLQLFADIVCSHIRSLQLFIESVTSSAGFPSVLCSSWDLFASGYCHTRNSTVMFLGEPCLTNASGLFFLKTGSSSPFALRFNITQKKLLNG
ncbi:pancreatic triacylglycerol lipase-like [Lycorma delicatula]|uniref:pancreatic triacylglycerol lipase-like n=1 Tax=Lycorma delicatula TaxID=130591 RepID=UPI003F51A75A